MKHMAKILIVLVIGLLMFLLILGIIMSVNEGVKENVEDSTLGKYALKTSDFAMKQFGDKDFDDDGMPNWYEAKFGTDIFGWDADDDPDNDGLDNIQEYDICSFDDGDSHMYTSSFYLRYLTLVRHISEEEEVPEKLQELRDEMLEIYRNKKDDGYENTLKDYCDKYSIKGRLNPMNRDTDNDGLMDSDEVFMAIVYVDMYTNPVDEDTDNDGFKDGDELIHFILADEDIDPLYAEDYDDDGDGLHDKYEDDILSPYRYDLSDKYKIQRESQLSEVSYLSDYEIWEICGKQDKVLSEEVFEFDNEGYLEGCDFDD